MFNSVRSKGVRTANNGTPNFNMPYNNTPITPTKEITGTVSLPLARVKKIIATDDDISNCSNNAAFVITVAAEMFLQHLVEQSHNIVKSERKPRRNIQYRDVANAVSRVENLEFLSDVVPKTTTFRQFKQKKVQEPAASDGLADGLANGVGKGQSTLDGHMTGAGPGVGVVEQQATNGATNHEVDVEAMDVDEEDDSERTIPVEPEEPARSPVVLVEPRMEEP